MLRGILLAGFLLAVSGGGGSAAPAPGLPIVPAAKPPRPCYGLLVATVREGIVYTIDESPQDGPITVRLWEGSLRPPAERKPEGNGRTFRGWDYGWTLDLFHWRIAHGHVWASCGGSMELWHKIPVEDLPLLDVRNEKGAAALRKKYGGENEAAASGFLTNFAEPSDETARKIDRANPPSGLGTGVGFGDFVWDILPTGPKTWDLFMAFRSRMYIWRCKEKPQRGPHGVLGSEGEQRGEPFDAGFHEPFFVYGKPEAPFFVTKSGKVFQLQRPEKGQPRVVKVWDDSKRPVRAILDDADTGRTFVAGPDLPAGAGRWFWFELADKPDPKPYDPAAVKVAAEEPLKPALAFARFLLQEGKLKAK